ncbi:Holliday junction resolvase RuvX [Chloroflexota bacterium]
MAISDPDGILASPVTIIDRIDDGQALGAIMGIITQHQVGQIVVGLPRSMDGSLGEQAEKVQTFTQKLTGRTEVPVEFRDERLTTVSARRLMQAASSKKTKGKARDDAVAAALILQGYLDEEHGTEL